MDLSRKTAYEILFEIEKEEAYSNLTINRFLKKIDQIILLLSGNWFMAF